RRVHADRAAGGARNHRHPPEPPAHHPEDRRPGGLRQRSQTIGAGRPQPPHRAEQHSSRQGCTAGSVPAFIGPSFSPVTLGLTVRGSPTSEASFCIFTHSGTSLRSSRRRVPEGNELPTPMPMVSICSSGNLFHREACPWSTPPLPPVGRRSR